MTENFPCTMIGQARVARLLLLLLVLCHESWGTVSDVRCKELSEGQLEAHSAPDPVVRSAAQDNSEKYHDTEAKTIHLDLNMGEPEDNLPFDSSRLDFPCPLSTAIAPCVCSVDTENNINLNCTDVESEDQLAAVFQQEFPVKELQGFYMASNDAIKGLWNILNGVSFESVVLSPGPFSLQAVSEYFLLSSRLTLRYLQIYDSELFSDAFPFAVLGAMEKLEQLSFYHSNITWIPKIYSPLIQKLGFFWGYIGSIEPGTFDAVPNLSLLSLHANSLTELRAGTVPIRGGPMEFYAFDNAIQIVEPGAFFFSDANSANSSEDIYIDLAPNRIQTLEAGTFPLRNGPVSILLYGNQISSIEPGTFVLPEATDSFTLSLNLRNNHLTTVDEAVFGDLMPFIPTMNMSGNPLSCDCDFAWLVLNPDFMAKLDEDATCADGTNLHDLIPEDFEDFC